jgi:M6 family metalloprotease-like protein
MTSRSMALALAILMLASAAPALAHGDHPEVVADAPVAKSAATYEGIVRKVTVDDTTTGVTRDYRLLALPDGTTRLLQGNAADSLEAGAQYVIQGTSHGKYVQAASAVRTAQTSAKMTVTVAPIAVDGTLRMGHIDYTGAPSEYFYAVFSADGHSKRLPGAEMLDALQNGMEVSVYGSVDNEGALAVERIVIHRHAAIAATNAIRAKAASSHTLFIVPVKFPTNNSAPFVYPAEAFSVAALDTAVFGASPNPSVVQYYKEVSYGQQTLAGVTAKKGTQWLAATQHPPVDSKGNATCDTDFIQNQGNAAALAAGYTQANLNPGNMTPGSTATANHVVFVFSQAGFNCGWSGLGYIGYGLAFVKQTTSLTVIGHELGHTFGLYHAGSLDCGVNPIGGSCTVSEYGDPFDVMGNSSAMHFSAFQKQMLKWIPDASVSTHSGGAATYTLNPIETAGGSRYAVRIPAGPNRTYWLEYRQPIGFDSGISATNANGAQVRVVRPFETLCSGCDAYSNDTELLDMTTATNTFADAALATGSRFVDNYYGIAIDVLSRTASALTVRVSSLGKTTAPDFDGNATTDLVWRSASTGQIMIGLMNGVTTSRSAVIFSNPAWKAIQEADLNGDGRSDLIWRNDTTGQTAAWLMNGVSALSSAIIFPVANWKVLFTGDFDGDGKSDLLWYNSVTGQSAIWLMNGLSSTIAAYAGPGAAWRPVQVGDFNGDGKTDIVWRNDTTGETAIWLLNGVSAIKAAVIFPVRDWSVQFVGDFDGDGKSDLLWYNSVTGQSAIWLMNGLSGTVAAYVGPGPGWKSVQVGDFNGDGKTDILWRNTSGATLLWLMNGTVASATSTLTADTNMSVAKVGDFDGNGKADIAWRNTSTGQTIIWLMNGLVPVSTATVMSDTNWSIQAPN